MSLFFKKYSKGLLAHLKHSLHPTNYQTVEEYIESRIHFGGMYPTIGMIEFVNGVYINELLFIKYPSLQQATEDCVLIGVLSNDLISYHKEKHSQHNLLNAYLKTNTVNNLDEAISLGLNLVNQCFESFTEHSQYTRKQIETAPLTERHIINIYLTGIEQLISASYHWQMSTNRYRSMDNIFEDLKYPVEEQMAMAI